MVVMDPVAVIVRSRAGRNIITQIRGLDAKIVLGAVQEAAVAAELGGIATKAGLDNSVAPCNYGKLKVLGGRLTALYRLINQTTVIVMSPEGSNIFSSIDLLAAVSRLLMVECKAVELPPERALSDKRYAQMYLAIDSLLSRGHGDPLRALHEAVAALGELAPGAAAAKKLPPSKDGQAADTPPRTAPKRKLGMQADLLGQFNFSTASAITITPTITSDHDPFALLPDATVQPGTSAQQVSSLDDLLGPSGTQPAALASQDPFAFADALQPAVPQLDQVAAAGAVRAPGEVARSLPQLQGPPLKLREVWRGEMVGGHVTRAGLHGQVVWASSDVRTLSPNAPFRLVPPEFPDQQLRTALRTSQRHERATEAGKEASSFVATSASPVPVSTPLLQYWLPAGFCKAPLVAQLGVATADLPNGTFSVQLGVQFAVSPDPSLHCTELTIDLTLPPTLGAPVRVAPRGEWSSKQQCLRWRLPAVQPAATGSASALFIVRAGREAGMAALRNLGALVRLNGVEGETLSGTLLQQASNVVSPLQLLPAACSWRAEVTARPAQLNTIDA